MSLLSNAPADPTGEREEVHAALGQSEGQRCGEELHVQQAHVCHLQHRAAVRLRQISLSFSFLFFFCFLELVMVRAV